MGPFDDLTPVQREQIREAHARRKEGQMRGQRQAGERAICGWEVDRRSRQPVLCGRPAKAQAIENLGDDQLVCAVHIRAARALGYEIIHLPAKEG